MDGSDVDVSAVLAALHGGARRCRRGVAHARAPCSDPALHPTTCARRGAVIIVDVFRVVIDRALCSVLGHCGALVVRMY